MLSWIEYILFKFEKEDLGNLLTLWIKRISAQWSRDSVAEITLTFSVIMSLTLVVSAVSPTPPEKVQVYSIRLCGSDTGAFIV